MPELHHAYHPEDCKLLPNKADNYCKILPMLPEVFQIATLRTYGVPNDDMRTAETVVYVGLPVLEDSQAHCELSRAAGVYICFL